MATIRHSLQREVFGPTDERLVGVVHVTKANKKKKSSFLCVAISHDKNSCATICQVKKTDKNVYKKQKSWALPELKAVDGKNPSKETLEFDLHLDKIYKWEASNAQERLLFFAVLSKLCEKYLPKQTPVFRNVPQNVLNEATQSLTAESFNKEGGSFDGIIPEEEYQPLTDKEEHDLERLLSRTESAIANAEAFTGYLAKELSMLDGANIHSLMGSEDQVMQLLELINAAELEAAKIETRLVTYENILQQARVAKSSVGDKNVSLETANNNNRKLLAELNSLITQLDMSHQHQMALIDADLTNPVGLQSAISAAQTLQRVMNAELSPGLERLAAVQDQKRRFEKWRAKFSASVARHLNNLFIHLGNDVGDTTSQSSRTSNLSIPKHSHLHTDLAPYTELMHWLKAMDRRTYDELIKVYTTSLSKLYERDVRTFFEEAKVKVITIKEKKRSDSGSETGSSGGSGSATKRGQGAGNAGTGVQTAQQCLLGLEPEFWVLDLESGDRKRLDELLESVLTELEPICLSEQEFCVAFFQLESLTNEGPVTVAKTPEKMANEEMRKTMSKLFNVLESELLVFISTYEKVDCYYSFYVLVRLGQHVMSAQDTGSFLSMAFGSALVQVKRTFDRFMQAQLKSIQESKPPKRNRCGILPFVANFAEFANTAEEIFRGSDRRVDLDKWYVRLIREMFEVIPKLANEHSKTPPEVIKMENYHRLHAMLSELKIGVLDAERKEAKQRYSDALKAYVVQYFGRPLEKLNHFFDGVQAKVAQGVKESEVGYQVMFSKQELRKVIAMYPGKEVKKGLDALYKKVEKHLSEDSTLLQVVWREMQDLFICQYKALEDMIERCYPGALISLEFSITDILSFFSEIAISH